MYALYDKAQLLAKTEFFLDYKNVTRRRITLMFTIFSHEIF